MARGELLGGAIPTAINLRKTYQSLPVRPYYVPQSRDFEGLGGQGILSVGGIIWMGLNFPKQTRLVLQSVGPSCGERDNPVRPLPAIFFADDLLEVE